MAFDSPHPATTTGEIESASKIDELSGKLGSNPDEERLMRSVMESDKQKIDDGKLITESINMGLGSFVPDMLFASITKNYRNAEKIMGETIIRELSGFDPNFVEKNVAIPEFQRELKQRIAKNVERLKKDGLIDRDGLITKQGMFLSSLILYAEELDNLVPKGLGEKTMRRESHEGDKKDYVGFRGKRYRDLAWRQTLKTTLRRGRSEIAIDDLRAFSREQHGKISIIYALDASGSMRGEKLRISKKAGIALAFKAIAERNNVGLLVFGSDIEKAIPPCRDFPTLLEELTKVRASMETDIALAITHSLELFGRGRETKHLTILTDALPTRGIDPERTTLQATSIARNHGITISIIGIGLDKQGELLAKKIAEIGEGRFYLVRDLINVDQVLLEDYYAAAQ